MKNFVICEKPMAGRDIAKFLSQKYNLPQSVDKNLSGFIRLGDEYVVGWCRGHLLALGQPDYYNSEWKQWNKDDLPMIPNKFDLIIPKTKDKSGQFVEDKGLADLLKSINTCFKQASNIINAGDCGREGQVIVDEVLEYFNLLDSKPVERLWVNGLNEDELEKGFNNLKPNSNWRGMYKAGQVRAQTDWLFGMNLSRAITINFKESGINTIFSAGRVQTPVIKMIYDRDMAIKNFKEKEFYSLNTKLSSDNGSVIFNLSKDNEFPSDVLDEEDRIVEKKYIEFLQNEVQSAGSAKVDEVSTKKKEISQKKLFSLSTLQQEANAAFKISASTTLEIVQSLYEKAKMVSYPRTSSNYLPKSQFKEVPDRLKILSKNKDFGGLINQLNGNYYFSKAWDDSKVSDHHAIIPIDFKISTYNGLSDIEKKVYDMITYRYLSHFFNPKTEEETVASVKIADKLFTTSTKRTLDLGWGVVYKENTSNESCSIKKGDVLTISEVTIENKKTTPPAKFNEGTIIGAMTNIAKYLPTENLTEEETKTYKNIFSKTEGIGTEATRATIIDNLKQKDFISSKNNILDITNKGVELIENLEKINMGIIASPITTAKYELLLSEIEKGDLAESEFMREFLDTLNNWVNKIKLNSFTVTKNIKINNSQAKKTNSSGSGNSTKKQVKKGQ